jgi:hypothetical protein
MTMKRTLSCLTIVCAFAAPLLALAEEPSGAKEGPWIHVEVREGDETQATINLPLSMAGVALGLSNEMIQEHHPGLTVEGSEVTISSFRQLWNDMRAAGDTEYLAAKDDDGSLRIFRKGDTVHIDGDGSDGEKLRVRVPVAVMDALLSGEGDELNIPAAVSRLAELGKGDLVQVEDGEDFVRVWIE